MYNRRHGEVSGRHWAWCVSLALFLGLQAGQTTAAEGVPDKPDTLTLYHWLQSPSESRAFTALTDLFKTQYPGLTVKGEPATRKASALLPAVEARVAAGTSPDSFMMHVGYATGMFRARGVISPVDDIWTAQQLETVTPPVVRSLSRIGDHYYAVPLNVHRTNLIWYNPSVLQKNGIDPATLTTWTAFFDATQKLRDQGMRYPIAIGADWIMSNAFECVIASQGIATYEDWINGKLKTKDDPRLKEAVRIFLEYLGYASEDDSEWDQTLKNVIAGQSAFYAMGDWVIGEFNLAGLQYGKDYGVILVPGTKGLFGMTVDAFSRPGKTVRPTNSDRWLKLVASRDGQDAFCLVKGCIPARTDAAINRYPEYQKSAITDFRSAKSFYPNLGAAVPMLYHNRFERAIAGMRKQRDPEKAVAALADAASGTSDEFLNPWSLK
jgi:glucose/mannose transport system substrate-binding protein